MEDFVSLILYPENLPNLLINCNIAGMLVDNLDKKSITSSAYSDILCSWSPIVIPDRFASFRIDTASSSMARLNNNGVDLSRVIWLDKLLLVLTHATGPVYSNCIHFKNFPPIPYLGNTLN